MLADQPEPPKYFAIMKHLNKTSRPLLIEVQKYSRLSKVQFIAGRKKGMKIIDARSKEDFAAGFIAGSLNIQGNNSFATWCGWLLKYQEQFVIIAEDNQMDDLTRKLMRIGLDNMYGYISEVNNLGIELKIEDVIALEEFKTYIGQEQIQIVDVRGAAAYEEGAHRRRWSYFCRKPGRSS